MKFKYEVTKKGHNYVIFFLIVEVGIMTIREIPIKYKFSIFIKGGVNYIDRKPVKAFFF